MFFTDKASQGEVVPMPTLPLVVKVPAEVVVALPPTQREFEMERSEVLAFPNVESPATSNVPVKLAEEEMVCPLMSPVVRVVENKLVEEAVVAKLVVEVALVVVLLSPVKLARVEEALETKPLLKYQERFVVWVGLAV